MGSLRTLKKKDALKEKPSNVLTPVEENKPEYFWVCHCGCTISNKMLVAKTNSQGWQQSTCQLLCPICGHVYATCNLSLNIK